MAVLDRLECRDHLGRTERQECPGYLEWQVPMEIWELQDLQVLLVVLVLQVTRANPVQLEALEARVHQVLRVQLVKLAWGDLLVLQDRQEVPVLPAVPGRLVFLEGQDCLDPVDRQVLLERLE